MTSPLTDEQIEVLFAERLTVDEFEKRLGCPVVRPRAIVTADYRPHKRNRFFPVIAGGVVVRGSFG